MGVVSCGTTMLDQGVFENIGAVTWNTTAKTSNFTATAGSGFFVNTTSAAITVTLPSSPSAGDIVGIKDYAFTADTNNITIGRNGSNIQGDASDFIINTEGRSVLLVYVDGTKGWLVTSSSQKSDLSEPPAFTTATGGTITTSGDFKIHTFTSPGTFCVSQIGNGPTVPTGGPVTASYLVVAGGGQGAGGFREGRDIAPSYTASPLVAGTGLTLTASPFPITVGGGGSAPSSRGSNSIFSTITSAGGGARSNPISPGGSGAGAGAPGAGQGTGNTPPVSPPQGSNGGTAVNGQSCAGGGGATEVGQPNNGPNNPGGRGGAGASTSITGSSLAYAGGGGGGGNPGLGLSGGAASPCGTGGRGNGSGGPANNGTTNRGGGGGSGSSASGGSGVVVIRYKFQ